MITRVTVERASDERGGELFLILQVFVAPIK